MEELVSEGTVRILIVSSNIARVSVDNVVIESKAGIYILFMSGWGIWTDDITAKNANK